ncbi:hypothetical protein C7475_104282 [Chitinophaga sp. S165]|nr:hypothetical protein C7475_104282 [Chitinophaga sp. S165]
MFISEAKVGINSKRNTRGPVSRIPSYRKNNICEIIRQIEEYSRTPTKLPTRKKPFVNSESGFYVSSNSFTVGLPGKSFTVTMILPPAGSAVAL